MTDSVDNGSAPNYERRLEDIRASNEAMIAFHGESSALQQRFELEMSLLHAERATAHAAAQALKNAAQDMSRS